MTGSKIHVGVIGGGIWGTYHLRAAKQLEAEGRLELVAVASHTQATATRQAQSFGIKGYTDYRSMIEAENLDAITVATPDHLHREIVIHALQHSLHVLVEKPMDLTTAGCRAMMEVAEEKGLLLQVDLHKRYDPYNIDIRRQVQEGKIGEPYYAYAYMEDKITVPSEWLSRWAAESSPFWFLGVHKYDLVRWVSGREAHSVFAHGCKGKLSSMGIDTYDAVSASILMDGGLTCTIDVNWILPLQFEAVVNQGLRIVGSDGLIELDSQDRGLRYCTSADGAVTPNLGAIFSAQSVFGWQSVNGYFVDAIKDFLDNVRFLKSGGSLRELEGTYPSGWDGLKVTQVAEAVQASIEEGRRIEVGEIG
ncbi:MAG: Gfo/Idh/MocA family oxidoreductase [Anaerolineae bacterium]|nr:MAG: Gfo/Idh/MocA family oxidoreductase [Anaerolineae bacterium]